MGLLRIITALFLGLIGVLATMTIIGAVIGIPLIGIAAWLAYKEQHARMKKAIKEGIVEGMKEVREKEQKEKEEKSQS